MSTLEAEHLNRLATEENIGTTPPPPAFSGLDFEDTSTWVSPIFTENTKHEQARIVRTLGERMRQARELCNLSQSVAARRLGYLTSAKLSKVEAAADTNSVPLWLIHRAASIYDVSTEFLFGFTDDFEVGSVPRLANEWLLNAWERARERDLSLLTALHREVATVSSCMEQFTAAARGMAAGIGKFAELNPDFEELRGGATVMAQLARLESVASDAEAALKRFRLGRHARPASAGERATRIPRMVDGW